MFEGTQLGHPSDYSAMASEPPKAVRLTISNNSDRQMALSLEPLGYYHDPEPHETRRVVFRLDTDPCLEIEGHLYLGRHGRGW